MEPVPSGFTVTSGRWPYRYGFSGIEALPYRFLANAAYCVRLPATVVNASGSYSSLERCVFHGDRLAPHVIHRPLALDVSTLWYFTSVSLPVVGFWSSVSTAIGDGRQPYMLARAWSRVVYSNCTTANTVLPVTPATFAP